MTTLMASSARKVLGACWRSVQSPASSAHVRLLSSSGASATSHSQPDDSSGYSEKYFTEYGVYKSSGAVRFSVIPPTWSETPKGDLALFRTGALFVELAPAVEGASRGGARNYQWEKQKISIALSPNELGTIISHTTPGSLDFYHDPLKGKAGEGATRKTISISTNPNGTKVFKANQTSNAGQERRSAFVPLTLGEFEVFKQLAIYSIPRMLGFDVVLSQPLKLHREASS